MSEMKIICNHSCHTTCFIWLASVWERKEGLESLSVDQLSAQTIRQHRVDPFA